MPYLDQAIVSLRRARLVSTPFIGETDYVLGKAYFNKGKYYYDLAIASMENSLASGYVQKDSHEYIGQAYTQLGDYEKAMEYFLTALKDDSGDLLLLTIGQTYYQMKRTQRRRRLPPADPQQDRRQGHRGAGALPPRGDLSRHGRAVQGGGAVRGDREDRPAVGRRALRPRAKCTRR